MKLRPIAAIALRQYFLYRSSPTRVLPLIVWVAVDVVLWGFITRFLNSVSHAAFDFTPTLLGAVLFWDFFIRVMQGVTTAFFEDVWSRNFLNVFASPISIGEYVTGLVVTSIATSSVGLLVMLVLATLLFGLPVLAPAALFVPCVLVLFLFGIALGVLASAMVLRYGPASEWLVWPIPALLSPFAGVFYPLSTLPAWMQQVARLLPPSYVFEGMREVIAGRPLPWMMVLGAGALAALQLLIAGWVFGRVFRLVTREGMLARYSAEGTA
jgi:ABC-2 type transport system permease protein